MNGELVTGIYDIVNNNYEIVGKKITTKYRTAQFTGLDINYYIYAEDIKTILTKEQFCKIIKRLREYNDLQDKIQQLFRDNIDNQEMDFMNAGSICVGHETIVVELLENMFKDKDIISWWIYEQNYGRDFSLGDLEADGVKIDLTTLEKLYDYLIKQMERE